MQVRSVYADRGFGTSTGDQALAKHRIRNPVIPRQQRAAPIEHTRNWKRRYRFRNGLEGRISQLKRKGLRRTRLRSLEGAQTWVGGITLAHNLQRMALSADPPARSRTETLSAPPRPGSRNRSTVVQGEVEPREASKGA